MEGRNHHEMIPEVIQKTARHAVEERPVAALATVVSFNNSERRAEIELMAEPGVKSSNVPVAMPFANGRGAGDVTPVEPGTNGVVLFLDHPVEELLDKGGPADIEEVGMDIEDAIFMPAHVGMDVDEIPDSSSGDRVWEHPSGTRIEMGREGSIRFEHENGASLIVDGVLEVDTESDLYGPGPSVPETDVRTESERARYLDDPEDQTAFPSEEEGSVYSQIFHEEGAHVTTSEFGVSLGEWGEDGVDSVVSGQPNNPERSELDGPHQHFHLIDHGDGEYSLAGPQLTFREFIAWMTEDELQSKLRNADAYSAARQYAKNYRYWIEQQTEDDIDPMEEASWPNPEPIPSASTKTMFDAEEGSITAATTRSLVTDVSINRTEDTDPISATATPITAVDRWVEFDDGSIVDATTSVLEATIAVEVWGGISPVEATATPRIGEYTVEVDEEALTAASASPEVAEEESIGDESGTLTAALTAPQVADEESTSSVDITAEFDGSTVEGAEVYAINRNTDEVDAVYTTDSSGTATVSVPDDAGIHMAIQYEDDEGEQFNSYAAIYRENDTHDFVLQEYTAPDLQDINVDIEALLSWPKTPATATAVEAEEEAVADETGSTTAAIATTIPKVELDTGSQTEAVATSSEAEAITGWGDDGSVTPASATSIGDGEEATAENETIASVEASPVTAGEQTVASDDGSITEASADTQRGVAWDPGTEAPGSITGAETESLQASTTAETTDDGTTSPATPATVTADESVEYAGYGTGGYGEGGYGQ